MFSISPVSLSSPAYRSSNISRSNVAFAAKGKLSQEKIDEYRRKFDVADPISPENTSKTYSNKRWIAEYATVVGAPSAGYKVVKGVDSHKDVFGRLKESAKQLAAGYETPTIVGLDHQTFLTKKEAEAYKNTINATPPNRVPYRVAFHPLASRKVLTFITNNPHKAAELWDKASSNPFDNVSISSGSSRSSVEEPRPSTSHVEEEEDDPFASPEDATKATRSGSLASLEDATKEIRSGSLVHNPFVDDEDPENPFKG